MVAHRTPLPGRAAPLLVTFSHLRWDFVWQRPQHLLTRAARRYRVIYIEEPVDAEGDVPALGETVSPEGVRVVRPMLPRGMADTDRIAAQRRLVAARLSAERGRPRVFWYYTPAALAFTDRLARDVTVYDNMDELSAFKGASPDLIAAEARLFARADVVFTGGVSLFEAKRGRHHNIHAVPSSIDARHFCAARAPGSADPADQAGLGRPRVGFFGVIDERMDTDFVAAVAERRPDIAFVMLGPVVKIDPETLPRRDNLAWLGSKAYRDLPSYLAGWDAGLMPFALNEATRFISPTKTPEFLAAGLPVVSTAIRDVIRPYGEKGLVEIARSPEEAVARLAALLGRSAPERARWLRAVDAHLAAGSWDQTWDGMDAIVDAALPRPARPLLPARVTARPAPIDLPAAE